ncbi:MAG: 3-hydroxyisobutyrate dehydrogenase [Rhodospirillaceae bacterium]
MANVAFIGLGNMGGPMAQNQIKAGHSVRVFDLSQPALDAAKGAGASVGATAAEAAKDADCVITMLPAGAHVRQTYLSGGIFDAAKKGAIFIDCSTIDVPAAREVIKAAEDKGFLMVDAPVSGGIAAAAAGTLTFMVGGADQAFAAAKPFLEPMGKVIVHAGPAGNGQVAKVCNNMLLGISMIGTCEAFKLAERLGLDAQVLFDISSKASGQCWSMTSYCPVPGPVPTSPANRDYKPGFAAAMMLKDLKLSQDAAGAANMTTPIGKAATELYEKFVKDGNGNVDFSGIIRAL